MKRIKWLDRLANAIFFSTCLCGMVVCIPLFYYTLAGPWEPETLAKIDFHWKIEAIGRLALAAILENINNARVIIGRLREPQP